MIREIASIDFVDEEAQSEAFVKIRNLEDKVALSISIKGNGDLDTLMPQERAKGTADVLYRAIADQTSFTRIWRLGG